MRPDTVGAAIEAEEILSRLIGLADSFERALGALRLEIASLTPEAKGDHDHARSRKAALAMIACRARIRAFAGTSLVQDAGFDILLDIFASQSAHRHLSVMDVCAGTGIPATTSRRWIKRLTEMGLVERRPDPRDQRRDWVGLSGSIFERLAIILDPAG
jgi:DNA-binding transcriptional ArsR family regulator